MMERRGERRGRRGGRFYSCVVCWSVKLFSLYFIFVLGEVEVFVFCCFVVFCSLGW